MHITDLRNNSGGYSYTRRLSSCGMRWLRLLTHRLPDVAPEYAVLLRRSKSDAVPR